MKLKGNQEISLDHEEVDRILKLAHYLPTEIYGALKIALTSPEPKSVSSKK